MNHHGAKSPLEVFSFCKKDLFSPTRAINKVKIRNAYETLRDPQKSEEKKLKAVECTTYLCFNNSLSKKEQPALIDLLDENIRVFLNDSHVSQKSKAFAIRGLSTLVIGWDWLKIPREDLIEPISKIVLEHQTSSSKEIQEAAELIANNLRMDENIVSHLSTDFMLETNWLVPGKMPSDEIKLEIVEENIDKIEALKSWVMENAKDVTSRQIIADALEKRYNDTLRQSSFDIAVNDNKGAAMDFYKLAYASVIKNMPVQKQKSTALVTPLVLPSLSA